MSFISPTVLGMIAMLLMAGFVIMVRMRAAKRPVSIKGIILPPIFMSTGFVMFHLPEAVTPLSYDLIAFFVGMVFSVPLILTSRFEIVGQDVFLKRSKAFFFILFGLLVIRFAIKLIVGDSFSPLQSAGLFFILAYGMIVPWRIAMLVMYRQLVKKFLIRT
ncbi:CcdC family protein [Brevibacillus fulvus]|uniref:Membrane protein CcdC involved in cytochrome C biogenesis n=1 Tax=Brevibacillus fulvus TaxID=1125967 RepID=A0A939BRE3_9BACL|nr:cytochrome c biogenesis protein CcdC [Brevibacillus fulvus]MBM7589383.1 membrane protein CcdC involved in cytochrome C biogenesis [Brevibacillus fulvus]